MRSLGLHVLKPLLRRQTGRHAHAVLRDHTAVILHFEHALAVQFDVFQCRVHDLELAGRLADRATDGTAPLLRRVGGNHAVLLGQLCAELVTLALHGSQLGLDAALHDGVDLAVVQLAFGSCLELGDAVQHLLDLGRVAQRAEGGELALRALVVLALFSQRLGLPDDDRVGLHAFHVQHVHGRLRLRIDVFLVLVTHALVDVVQLLHDCLQAHGLLLFAAMRHCLARDMRSR